MKEEISDDLYFSIYPGLKFRGEGDLIEYDVPV